MSEFEIFKPEREQTGWPENPPAAPPWRSFAQQGTEDGAGDQQEYRGRTYCPSDAEIQAVNAAIHLRRPLLLTGDPGCGKSSLAYAIAWRLNLGEVLFWGINSQTTIRDGLYKYDAISRLRDANLAEKDDSGKTKQEPIEKYLSLGPLGTALAPRKDGDARPRVLLIDELDKSDIDLPNDLLDVFEEGFFDIDELVRIKEEQPQVDLKTAYRKQEEDMQEVIPVQNGHVQCVHFPIIVITSNMERQFPPAFLRRCLRHDVKEAGLDQIKQILEQHGLSDKNEDEDENKEQIKLVEKFLAARDEGTLNSNDQLLNALYLLNSTTAADPAEMSKLIDKLILRNLRD